MPIIDSQVHAYEANTPQRPWHSVPNWPDHATGDEMVAAMDKVGVDGAIFISAFSMYRYDASYAVEVQRAQPGRFAIVKPVDPDDPAVGDIIADWKQTPGAVGIRIMLTKEPGRDRDPNDRTIGRNVRIETRWAGGNTADIRRHAAELVALAPDVILTNGGSTVGELLQASRTVPVVFANVGDPVGAGLVDSLARPAGNATGFMAAEYSLSGKLLELLKQIAPGVTRAAVLRETTQGGTSQFATIQAVAPSLRVEVNPVNVRDASEIERVIAAFARAPNGGLVVMAGGGATLHRNLIITLAARHKLPAVYFERFFVAAGGLISYGHDRIDQFRQAAGRRRRWSKLGEWLRPVPPVSRPTRMAG